MTQAEENNKKDHMGQTVFDDRLAVSIVEATRLSGIGRSSIYNAIGQGKLSAVKHGSKTLILLNSLRALVENLPPATIRMAKKQAA